MIISADITGTNHSGLPTRCVLGFEAGRPCASARVAGLPEDDPADFFDPRLFGSDTANSLIGDGFRHRIEGLGPYSKKSMTIDPSQPPPATSGRSARRWRSAVPAMALAAGLIFGTSAALARAEPPATSEPSDLAGLIKQRNTTVERLTAQAGDLSTEVEELERSNSSTLSTQVSRQADALAPQVGLGAVRGPGVRVSLDDAGYTLDTLPAGYTVDDVVVHQQDVQAVVNAMWAGGAEAMMIQDQRIIASSAIQCVGNTLYLQGRVYSPPYTITAIGDVDSLITSLEQDPIVDTYRGWSATLGLGYTVDTLTTVQMPGFASVPPPEFVRISTPEDDGAATTEGRGTTDIDR